MNHHLKMLTSSTLVRQFSLNVNRPGKKNHYDCLGVTPKATQGDIKNAYYKLSKQYHPDTNSGSASAAERFRDIAEAYEILGNLKARKLYDRGIVMRNDSQPDEPVNENYKHASFYKQRNKPTSTKSTFSSKTTYYDMDAWTRAHYSETFATAYSKKRESHVFVQDKNKTKTDNKFTAQLVGVIVLLMGFGFVYGTDASRQYDKVKTDVLEEKPD